MTKMLHMIKKFELSKNLNKKLILVKNIYLAKFFDNSVGPPCESCQNGRHNEPLPVLPGNELNQSSPKLKTMVVKTINCHHFICLFYQACAISA